MENVYFYEDNVSKDFKKILGSEEDDFFKRIGFTGEEQKLITRAFIAEEENAASGMGMIFG